VVGLTTEPTQKSTLQQLRVEAICLCTPVLARDRHARWVDDIGFDLMCTQPACQPEAVARDARVVEAYLGEEA